MVKFQFPLFLTTIALLPPAVIAAGKSSNNPPGQNEPNNPSRNRKLIRSNQSIAEELKNEHAQGRTHSRFTLHAEVAGFALQGQGQGQGGADLAISVREPVQAVTPQTTVSLSGGHSRPVGTTTTTVLVQDYDEDEESSGSGETIVLLLADLETDDVRGVYHRGEEEMNIGQKRGMRTFAVTADEFTAPDWQCDDASQDTPPAHGHTHNEVQAKIPHLSLDEDGRARVLMEVDDHSDHEHNHDHHDHDDSHTGDHHHHHHHFDGGENTEKAFADIKKNLRGSDVRYGERRRLQESSAPYNYQVDVYVEIDNILCEAQDDATTCEAGPGPNTVSYINALFTGANTIYESEIDTHLNVLHIALSQIYDNASSTSSALSLMLTNHGRDYGADAWHYTSDSGHQPDLHHALLGKNLGGGIAYKGVLCRPDYGFGVSTGLVGNYQSMSSGVIWDMKVFMHELGHNFGASHTHDTSAYDPAIDTCGSSYTGYYRDCPGVSAVPESSTIMSYCHMCGGYSAIDYTFGGKYSGSGSRADPSSYTNTLLEGNVSTDAKRVNALMWNHVNTRTNYFPACLAVTPTCSSDADCDDGIIANGAETCASSVCIPGTPPAGVCGNGICDPGEGIVSCPSDCTLTFETTFNAQYYGNGNVFKIKAVNDITITGFTIHAYSRGTGSVKVWDKPGDYAGHQYNPSMWNEIQANTVVGRGYGSGTVLAKLATPISVAAGSFHSFYFYSTDLMILFSSGTLEGSPYKQNSDIIYYEGKFNGGSEFGGVGGPYVWNGIIEYGL